MGWEMKEEDAPNKIVHPEDLAAALARLHAHPHDDVLTPADSDSSPTTRRTRSSTIV